jgi:hypothetical protein
MGAPLRNPELPRQPRPTLELSPPPRDPGAYETAESAVRNFSIVLGGPLYDFLVRRGLVRITLPNVLRRILVVLAVAWLPLLLLSLKDGVAFGHQVTVPFLSDFAMYGRLLLGFPLLLLAEIVIDPAVRIGVGEFVRGRLVPDEELPKFEKLLRRIQRLEDAFVPEAILFVLAFFPVFLFQHEWTAAAVSSWHTTRGGLTQAGWWFAVFSGPLLRFMIYRWGFRYFLWALLVGRVSRLRLVLMPTHPDQAAGLNFLGITQKHFGILFCALGCSFAGRVANSMVFEGRPLSSFKFLMVGFVVLSLVVALLPLTLVAPKLMKVRRAGLLDYGRLANSYTGLFDRKWVHSTERPPEPLLGSSDIQSLADLGNSFGFVDRMMIAPINKRLVVQMAVLTAAPLIPVILFGTPTGELLKAVMKMVA